MLDGRLVCHIVCMLQGHVQEHQLSMYNIIAKALLWLSVLCCNIVLLAWSCSTYIHLLPSPNSLDTLPFTSCLVLFNQFTFTSNAPSYLLVHRSFAKELVVMRKIVTILSHSLARHGRNPFALPRMAYKPTPLNPASAINLPHDCVLFTSALPLTVNQARV